MIQILKQDVFFRYKKRIGIAKYVYDEDSIIFMDSDRHQELVDTKELESCTDIEILDEISSNDELKKLALDAEYIFIRTIDPTDYLNYCSSFN